MAKARLSPKALARSLGVRLERKFIEPQRVLAAQGALRAARAAGQTFDNLWSAELKVFSQFGEDGILDYLCDLLSISKPRILEIGAGDFTECNSRFLAEVRGASVYAVDGTSGLLRNLRKGSLAWRTSLHGEELWVTPDNVRGLTERARHAMGGVDILSLDIDGNDFWVLQRIPLEGVAIAVIEYNPILGPERAISVPRKDAFSRELEHWSWLYYGASLRAFVEFMARSGFRFVGSNRPGNNAFFVRSEFAPEKSAALETEATRGGLASHTDWRIRDARDSHGQMSYRSASDALSGLSGLPVVNTLTGAHESL